MSSVCRLEMWTMPAKRLLVKVQFFKSNDVMVFQAQYFKISVYYHRGDFINKGDAVYGKQRKHSYG